MKLLEAFSRYFEMQLSRCSPSSWYAEEEEEEEVEEEEWGGRK